MTVMTLMTLIYGLILERGVHLYFLGPYPFNLTRRTRRAEQKSYTYAVFEPYDCVGFSRLADNPTPPPDERITLVVGLVVSIVGSATRTRRQ